MLSDKSQKFLISLFVFLIPTQLALHFWPNYAFIFGIRVDYFAPSIYLTDILILILIIINFKLLIKYKKIMFLLLCFALLNSAFSILHSVTLFKWVKILEYFSLAIVLKNKDISKPLYYSVTFFSCIGIIQFLMGSTTGLFYLLGERSFNINTPAIALTQILGKNYMRAYSTFPHPNALAGYIGLSLIYLTHKKFKFNWLLVVSATCFILTFSLSAFLGISIYFLFKDKFHKYFIFIFLFLSLLLPFATIFQIPYSIFTESVEQRLTLAIESGRVVSNHFLTGSGLGTFPKFSTIRQPVHNLFLLIFSELGIFGFLGIIYLLLSNFKKYTFLLFVLVVGLMDHYFLTINQNIILLFIITSLW